MNFTGIRIRLLLLGIIPAFFLVAVLAYYFVDNQFHELERSINERGDIITRQLASASIYGVFSGNNQILQELVDTILQEKDVVSAQVYNQQGYTLAEASLLEQPENRYLLNFNAPVILKPVKTLESDETSLFYSTGSKPASRKIGDVQINLSMQSTLASQQTVLYNSLIISITGLLITALFASRLGHTISNPLIKLTQAVNDISKGNMSARADFRADAEIAYLRDGFNVMAIGLQKTQQYLEQRVKQATNQQRETLKDLETQNLTLEQAKEYAIAQNEIKSQFLAHISHEIRTPMNGIIGFADLLLKSELNMRQSDHLLLIRDSATNLLAIVNEILELSSLESGNFSLKNQNFNFRSCLEDAVSLFIPNSKHVELILDIADDIPLQINNDPTRLQQIVTNLLGNSVKFTHRGHIIVRCRLLKDKSKRKSILLTISDTGTGIAPANLAHLFSPFLHSSQYAINNETGTGLGLTIAKNIVERMRGQIGVQSRENIGTTFWASFPARVQNNLQPTANRNIAVIVIDPFIISRRAFSNQLVNLGYSVRGFDSIGSYLSLSGFDFDLVFYRVFANMPKVSELYSLFCLDTATENKPVILLHATSQQTGQADSINALQLPCRSSYLTTIIDTNLRTAPMRIAPTAAVNDQSCPDLSVLIVDDNEINRLLLKAQIETHCRHLDLAGDGVEALNYLQTTQYNLALVDLQMPGLSGLELIKQARRPDCRNANTRIVAITAHAQSGQRDTIIAAGFNDCLIKPIVTEQIAELLSRPLAAQLEPAKINHLIDERDYVGILLSKTQNNKALVIKLFNQLFAELPDQIDQIKTAIAEFDTQLARETTHKLHGSASFCSLTDIKNNAQNVETALSENNPAQIKIHFQQLENEVANFLHIKQDILNRLHKETSMK